MYVIKRSLDELAVSCLCYDYTEFPRLVHRLHRDSSGILVMVRTQRSTFRLKTSAASNDVVVDNGKSDRITMVENAQNPSSQHAHITEWLELSPVPGRKHQLRVHCAEVLGTPIVGDFKYRWQAQRKWKHLLCQMSKKTQMRICHAIKCFLVALIWKVEASLKSTPSSPDLHCEQLVLPNVSQALQVVQMLFEYDFSDMESIELGASLPSYMQNSCDMLSS
ncbi:RNA pseudouridine synthase 4, mitochondrial-like [Hevea brasiliensis]|uniref:RNA pseudouridine synthase 4, mitochondrial-like n=1 Tax=Hevea brasiliensis TaxID=3981 RepID=UPI0025E7C4B3|nr:RNA pseudouridine synthase 4, mitochondrial-like [Hevea brasiliensis]